MNSDYGPDRLAEGAIRIAISRFATAHPFHARVLEKFRLVASRVVETMAVALNPEGVQLLFNPDFVMGLSADFLCGVLMHEVHHVVLGHLSLNPNDFPDSWAFIVACEVSVNEFVTVPLPDGAIRREQFPDLPPLESTRERYRRLTRVAPNARYEIRGGQSVICPGARGTRTGEMFDSHEPWSSGTGETGDPDKLRSMIASLLNEAAAEAGGVPAELQSAVRAMGQGTAGQVYILAGGSKGTLDWRQVLRRYIGSITETQASYMRPPRRFPNLVGIVPGILRRRQNPVVVAILDTSGSITDRMLEEIDGELNRLSRTKQVVVVEADAEVRRTYRYARRLAQVQGRGGTDFRPALDRRFLAPLKPDVVIYFTDGQGPAPSRPPPFPVIWCLVPGGEPPADFGRVIRMAVPTAFEK